MERWRQEGWNVLSVSAPVTQADGTLRWSVALQRPGSETGGHYVYSDSRIALIKRGRTTEAQLLEWFGPPEARALKPDGQSHLNWTFAKGTGPHSGLLSVTLSPHGKVIAYAARSGPGAGIDNGAATQNRYDDRQVAEIEQGRTTAEQLEQWFGPPENREVKQDGKAHLSWSLGRDEDGTSSSPGVLSVDLASNGKVVAYSAKSLGNR